MKSGGGGVAAIKALFPLIRAMDQQQALGFVPPLPGASALTVCVSGYTSEARDSVGQLCHLLGIKYVPPHPPPPLKL